MGANDLLGPVGLILAKNFVMLFLRNIFFEKLQYGSSMGQKKNKMGDLFLLLGVVGALS
jgi:hypothetical protein